MYVNLYNTYIDINSKCKNRFFEDINVIDQTHSTFVPWNRGDVLLFLSIAAL